jgi:hypothetical protein
MYRHDERDAFHPWTIAQNETDFWLRSTVQYLANLSSGSEEERNSFGAKLANEYARFPRRRMNAVVQVKELERLLSFPAWKKRYAMYGVWVATEIVRALEGHGIKINHADGELRFAFAESRIVDVETARPRVSLFSERRTPLKNPLGKSRVSSVQPDFSVWSHGAEPYRCVLVIEVKHYKKPSQRNFREALIDYASAHPRAKVVLVNYGPIGSVLKSLPDPLSGRCELVGYLNPEDREARGHFREVVRSCVGEPVTRMSQVEPADVVDADVIAVDTSRSMAEILESNWFWGFIGQLRGGVSKIALVDNRIRAFETKGTLKNWLTHHELGHATSLSEPISELLREHGNIIVVTDQGGLSSLSGLVHETVKVNVDGEPEVKLIKIVKRVL